MSDGLQLLGDVSIVDFTQALSGPYCTLMLADLGADVVKVEKRLIGDDSRHWGPPFIGEDAAYFMSVNRNKRSLALDLKDPADLAVAQRLVDEADVVVENWRPGTAARLGLDAQTLRARTPRLIHCSISGFGQDGGPRSGSDQIVQGESGVMSLTGPIGQPTKWGVPIGDISAGMFAASAILAALYDRRTSNEGRTIDIAMQDSLVSMLTHHAARYLNGAPLPQSDHNGHAAIAPYGLFRAGDGFINICVGNNSQFVRMCGTLDAAPLATDPRFATNADRLAHKTELIDLIEEALMSLSVDEALLRLAAVGVPAGRVRDIGEVLDAATTDSRQMILDFERADSGPARVVNTPWKFDGLAPQVRLAPPRLGEQNAELDHARPIAEATPS